MKYILSYILFFLTITIFGDVQFNNWHFREISLSNNGSAINTYDIVQDKYGFIWIATEEGLIRYDGDNAEYYRHNHGDVTSISGNKINTLLTQDSILWVSSVSGLDVLNLKNYNIERLKIFKKKKIDFNFLNNYNNNIIFFSKKGIYQYSKEKNITRNLIKFNDPQDIKSIHTHSDDIIILKNDSIWSVENHITNSFTPFNHKEKVNLWYRDKSGNHWVIGYNNIYVYNYDRLIIKLNIDSDLKQINGDIISICEDNTGGVWIATSSGEIIRFNYPIDKNNLNIKVHLTLSVRNKSKIKLYNDISGNIWVIGADKTGYFINDNYNINHIKIKSDSYINDNWIRGIVTLKNGNIWCCGNSGVYGKTAENDIWKHYNSSNSSLQSDFTSWITKDSMENVWISCDSTIYLYNKNNDDFIKIYKYKDQINTIFCDKDNNIWALQKNGTIFKTIKNHGEFHSSVYHNPKYYKLINRHSGNCNFRVLHIDNNDILWVGGLNCGLIRIDLNSGQTRRCRLRSSSQNKRVNTVYSINEHKNGDIFIGSSNGVYRYVHSTGKFNTYSKWDGLSSNIIYGIISDNNGVLWIGTQNGLTSLNIESGISHIINFSGEYKSNVFTKAVWLDKKLNTVCIGTNSGFISFNPDKIKLNSVNYPIRFTSLSLNNKVIQFGEGNESILSGDINQTKELNLPHNLNDISLSFTSPNFRNYSRQKFSWRLHPFEKKWNTPSSKIKTSIYTNIAPGKYKFQLRVSDNFGGWNNNQKELDIIINPPYWKSLSAYILYSLIFIVLTSVFYRIFDKQKKLRKQIQKEKYEKDQQKELNEMKLKFFTSISHELKTPLSLLVGPLEDIRLSSSDKDNNNNLIDVAFRNAKHLQKLIDQLMDFRKAEMGKMKFSPEEGNIISLTNSICRSFEWMATEKNINFTIDTQNESLWGEFDASMYEKLLFNLLSNAFKYTNDNGSISISTNFKDDRFLLTVQDNGSGIKKEDISKIFDRYYQGSSHKPGTGIGLALVKELATLQNGIIDVESEEGKGSKFTFSIPFNKLVIYDEAEQESDNEKLHITIIEDNSDIRNYLSSGLKELYSVSKFENGAIALEEIKKSSTDIIISDVMMPVMNGHELCSAIKSDINTSHIPVILLSALSETEDKIEGIKSGADSYVTKPFSMQHIKTVIESLLNKRKSVQKRLQQNVTDINEDDKVSHLDKEFIEKAKNIVLENIDNSNLDVSTLTSELSVSRTLLHLKLKNIAGQSTTAFIRNIRLNRAAELLKKGYNVSEVAYKTGFSDPRYFSSCFKKQFGMNPSKFG